MQKSEKQTKNKGGKEFIGEEEREQPQQWLLYFKGKYRKRKKKQSYALYQSPRIKQVKS